ncbi:MAG: hypothetical protein HGB04_04160, partial [Chlorobiaceae bacterium]|nr:hypothetical protein [Chlorobiaceae bacterium]
TDIADLDGSSLITAGGLVLSAGSGIGSGSNALNTAVSTLSAEVGSDGMFVSESSGLAVGSVTVTVQRVDATAGATGSIEDTLSNLASAGNLVATTVEGSFATVAGGGEVRAAGNILLQALSATADLMIDGSVSSSAGNISLDAGRDLLLNAAVSTSVTGGTIDLIAGDDVAMTDGSSVTGTDGAIRMEAVAGSVTTGTVTAGNGNVAIVAGTDISDLSGSGLITAAGLLLSAGSGIGSGSNSLDTKVTTLSAESGLEGLFVNELNGMAIGSVTVTVQRVGLIGTSVGVSSTMSDIESAGDAVLHAYGDLFVGSVTAVSVTLVSGDGSILHAEGSSTNVFAATLDLQAQGAIGTADDWFRTAVDTLTASSLGSGQSGIYLAEDDAIDLNAVTAGGNGDIFIASERSVVTVSYTVTASGGDISIDGLRGVVQAAGSLVSTTGSGAVTIATEEGGITMAAGAATTTQSGTITYAARRDIFLAHIASADGSMTIVSESGSITGTASVAGANISTAGDVRLRAGGRIGSGSFNASYASSRVDEQALTPLKVDAGRVSANSATGDVHLFSYGTLTVAALESTIGIVSHGNISLTSQTGDVVLSAGMMPEAFGQILLRYGSGRLIENVSPVAHSFKTLGQTVYLWDLVLRSDLYPFLEKIQIKAPTADAPIRRISMLDRFDSLFGLGQNGGERLMSNDHGLVQVATSQSVSVRMVQGRLQFRWGRVEQAESYMLVIEQDRQVFASQWMDKLVWDVLDPLDAGYYEFSVYAWTQDGLVQAYGPLLFRV